MRAPLRPALRTLALIVTAGLAACGGGSAGSAPPTVSTNPPAIIPPSTAPTGAPTTCSAAAVSVNGTVRRTVSRAANGVDPHALYVTYRAAAGRSTQSVRAIAGVTHSIDLGNEGGMTRAALRLADDADANAVAASLRSDPNVVSVAPVHVRSTAADAVANDPYLETTDQWYLYRTSVDGGAWAATHGSTAVKVAVIDTGVDESNADLAPKLDVREKVLNGVVTTGAGSVQDTDGHGTNVAGLAAAQTNNGYGFAGVGYDTHLLVFKVFPDATSSLPCPTANTADEARAIRDAVADGASVINLSLGSPQSGGVDQAEQQAVAFAIASNVTVVAAAGNEYPSADGNQPDYPGAYPGVISVGASAVQDAVPNQYASITAETIASYSNSGPTLVAPGGDATGGSDTDVLHWVEGYSTTTDAKPADQCSNSGGVCRVLFNGTSQATPQVSGTIALMEAKHGGARSLTPAQNAALLTANSDQLPGISTARQGAGRLDAAKAVAAAR